MTLLIHVLVPQSAAAQDEPAAGPCEERAEYRQFDFWVGEWRVFTADGQLAGTNRIEKLLNGCLLLEHWRSVQGGEGRSINYFDPGARRWVQAWVDAQGTVIAVQGALDGGVMRFSGDHVYPDGRRERFRMTFTPQADGRVRQFIEQSKDGGAWYVWFDGMYVRSKD